MEVICDNCGHSMKVSTKKAPKKSSPKKWDTAKLKLNDPIPFGKYKGMLLQDVIEEDEGYYEWLLDGKVIELVNE